MGIVPSTGFGADSGCPRVYRFTLLRWPRFAGQSGKHETKLVSNSKSSNILLKIVCHPCSLLSFWAGLQKEEFQVQIKEGVEILLSLACQLLMANHRRPPPPRMIPDARSGDDEVEDGVA